MVDVIENQLEKEAIVEKPASPEKNTVEEEDGLEGKIGNQETGKYEFLVGDLVWGKIKSYPWWPGQIYDPLDASEFALKVKQDDRLLVAYFGDGTYAWCIPSQLVPFTEYFEEMSKQSSSRRFANAVDMALDELGRRAELKLTNGVGLSRPQAMNAGVRAGVLVPEGDVERLAIPNREPAEVLEHVRRFGRSGLVTNGLDLVVTRGWLSAFYRVTRGSGLPMYHEPEGIEGLEDKSEDVVLDPLEEDRPSLLMAGPGKGPQVSDGKLMPREKHKSVAELMGDDSNLKAKRKRTSISGDKSPWTKGKVNREAINEGGTLQSSTTGRKSGRNKKPKIEVSKSPVESEKSPLSRERKKSKYLSPPFITPPHKRIKVATVSSEPPVTVTVTEATGAPSEVLVKEVLVEVQRACVDHMSLNTGSIEMIKRFITAFRSSVYVDESRPELKARTRSNDRSRSRETEFKKAGSNKLGGVPNSVSLVVSFPPGVSLPSQDELVKTFSRYGNLNKDETKALANSNTALVSFSSMSDAEKAFNEAIKQSPYSVSEVSYRLEYSSAAAADSGARESHQKVSSSHVGFIRLQIETLTGMLEKCDGKVSPDDKASLEREIRSLLEKMSGLAVRSSG